MGNSTLDTLSKKVLTYMQKEPQNIYYFQFDLDQMANSLSADTEALRAAVRYLEENGFIKYQRTTSGHTLGFYLDHKGLHYEELSKIEKIDFLKKSVLVPILVTMATNGIIALLKWLLPLIQGLLSHTP